VSGAAAGMGEGVTGRLSRRGRWLSFLTKLAVFVALMLLWHAVTVTEIVSPFFLPQPGAVLTVFWRILSTGRVLPDLGVTFFEFAVAGPLAVVTGVLTGYLISMTRYSAVVMEPVIASLYAIPIIIFYPISIMALGIGPESKIAHGALFGFFPICLNTIQGFGGVDAIYLRMARSTGATKAQLLRRILIPAAAPTILNGVRLGLMLCFLAIIGGETIASLEGLGHRIVWYAEGMQMTNMFAYIVFVILIATVMNVCLSLLEMRRRGA
jgi:ABC-type nitrate/sulfonate/bicarbonate transport system permease component